MIKEHTFDTGVVSINFAQGPSSGPPLVLLHGGGDRWQHFLPIIPSLVVRWHVFALDLRGHGKSGRVSGQYRPEHYVADVVAFIERQFTERVILFGHSLGGWVALLLAAQQADKVGALILGDPPLCMERFLAIESSKERLDMWRMMQGFAALESSVPELARTLARLPMDADAAYFRGWAKTLSQVDPGVAQYHAQGRLEEYVEMVNLEASLRQITCPVLLLQGDQAQGGVVSDADAERALSLLADGVHVRLDGAGHDLGLGTWDVTLLLRAVTNFVESL